MNAMQARLRPNSLERAGYEMLLLMGAEFLPQHMIGGRFCVDAFLPAASIVIQFDGDYWHGNPQKFPTPDARQKRRMSLDRSQDAYMKACGYRVVRLWENEIKRDPRGAEEAIRRAIHATSENRSD